MMPEQIQQVLDALRWTRTRLAAELDITENTVHQWMSGRRNPSGPACILMRQWLDAARAKKSAKRKELPVA